jgi:predicted deacylase
MNKIHRIKSIFLFTAMSVIFMAGCGDASSPEEIAKNYIKASFNNDIGTMKKLATSEFKKYLEANEGEIKNAQIATRNNLKQQGFSEKDIKELINNTQTMPAEYVGTMAVVHVKSIINLRVSLKEEKEGVWKVSASQFWDGIYRR